jgi:hypothetical protein
MVVCQECGLPIPQTEVPVTVRPPVNACGLRVRRRHEQARADAELVHERCVHDAARRGLRPLE